MAGRDDDIWLLKRGESSNQSNPIWSGRAVAGPPPSPSSSWKNGGHGGRGNGYPSTTGLSSRKYEEEDDEQLPIHAAAFFGKYSLLSDLISKRDVALQDRDSNGNSVLHYCCEGGDRSLGCLTLLLQIKGVEKNAQNDQGFTPLHSAAARNHENTMHALLLSSVDMDMQDADGNTAMHIAGMSRSYRCVELLIANGADQSIRNNNGLTHTDVTPPPLSDLCSPAPRNCCKMS